MVENYFIKEVSMARFSAAVPLLAVAGLAACATDYTNPPVAAAPSAAGAIVTAPVATVTVPAVPVAPAPVASYRTGYGVVQSVAQVAVPAVPSASAGSSTAAFTAYRLAVRMDDGTIQTIDQDSRAFAAGDRIQITPDGHVLRY